MDAEEDIPSYKVAMIGGTSVGKSAIVMRYHNDTFAAAIASTVGATYTSHVVSLGEKSVELQIWATAGEEK